MLECVFKRYGNAMPRGEDLWRLLVLFLLEQNGPPTGGQAHKEGDASRNSPPLCEMIVAFRGVEGVSKSDD